MTGLGCVATRADPIASVVTGEGLDSLKAVESFEPFVPHPREALIGREPIQAGRITLRSR